jgi:hypothetical protein
MDATPSGAASRALAPWMAIIDAIAPFSRAARYSAWDRTSTSLSFERSKIDRMR